MIAFLGSSLIGNFFRANILKIIMGFGVIIILGTALFYYNWSKKEIETLRQNQVVLENSVKTQKKTIADLQKDIERIKKISNDLRKRNLEYQQDLEDLKEKFTKNGRDFGDLASKKPGLVGRIINEATEKEMECIERLTRNLSCD